MSVDDLRTWQGVVLGRAVSTLRSVETQPSAWGFVLSVRRDPIEIALLCFAFLFVESCNIRTVLRAADLAMNRFLWLLFAATAKNFESRKREAAGQPTAD